MIGLIDIIVAGVLANQAGGELDENSKTAMTIGCFILLALAMAFFGTLMGIAGVILPDRKKVFGIVGIIINVLVLAGVGGLMCLGLAAG